MANSSGIGTVRVQPLPTVGVTEMQDSPPTRFRAPNGLMLSRVAAPPSGSATQSVAQNEARKRRANERRYVGSCNELGRHAAVPRYNRQETERYLNPVLTFLVVAPTRFSKTSSLVFQ